MNLIDLFAKKHNTTRYKIAKISGIQQTTLLESGRKPIDKMTVKTLKAVSLGAGINNVGATLNELLELDGNPLIKFIQAHDVDKSVVSELEDLIIWHGLNGGAINQITFNRYYEEGEDTDERATIALKNVAAKLKELKEELKKDD